MAMWTGDAPLHNQPIQIRSHRRRRAELSDWTIPIGHEQPLAALNAPKILAEVLTELGYTHRTRHVQNCSISGMASDGHDPIVELRAIGALNHSRLEA